jgi:hypothetical protein
MNKQLIPLSQQPAHIEASLRINKISAALTKTTEDLERLQSQKFRAATAVSKPEGPSDLDRAIAISEGRAEGGRTLSLDAEITRLAGEKRDLERGLKEAYAALRLVDQTLSREAGLQTTARHVAVVTKVLECLQQLCEANKEEQEVRDSLVRAGYGEHGLPFCSIAAIGRIDDHCGSPAFYFSKDAKQYIHSHSKGKK